MEDSVLANLLYPAAKAAFLAAGINLSSGTIKLALSSASYNAAHDMYDDVSASTIGTPQTLGSKTLTSGVFDAADPTYSSVASGTVSSLILYDSTTGVGSTSPLIAFIDTGTGIPVTANGGDRK